MSMVGAPHSGQAKSCTDGNSRSAWQCAQNTITGTSSTISCDPCRGVSWHATSYENIRASLTTPASAPSLRCTALTCTPRRCDSSKAASTMPIAIESSCILSRILYPLAETPAALASISEGSHPEEPCHPEQLCHPERSEGSLYLPARVHRSFASLKMTVQSYVMEF